MMLKAFLLLITSLLLPVLPAYSLEFPTTGDRGAPERTQSGGRRDDLCQLPEEKSVRAIVPYNNVSTFSGQQASLWLHVPAEIGRKEAEVFVQNPETFEVVYQKSFFLSDIEETGLIQVNLPSLDDEGEPLLSEEQDYFWEFAVICDASDRSRDHVAQGFIQRVENAAAANRRDTSVADTRAGTSAGLRQQAEAYAEAGLWQETLAIAAQLRETEPAVWSQLLSSVGLSAFVNEPFLDCCWPPET